MDSTENIALNRRENKIKCNCETPPEQPKYDIPQLIQQLKTKNSIPNHQLVTLIRQATTILSNQPNVLKLSSSLIIVGDIHGQFYDLINIFEKFGYPPKTRYLFLGDYVDRGKFCIEVVTLLLAMKVSYEKDFFLLRGNHECRTMTTVFNFKQECEYKYNSQMYQILIDLFTNLPLCAIVDNRYFAVHAGISPQSKSINDIIKINRFSQIPQSGILCDLLWSDPLDENKQQWMRNKNRSCSYFYTRNHSSKFLKQNTLRMIIRGHQVQMPGYKYQYGANQQPLALTIFSAPRYCDVYKNKGAVVVFTNKNISIQVYKQVEHPFVLSNYLNSFEISFPLIAAGITKIFAFILKVKKNKKLEEHHENRADLLKTLKKVQGIESLLKGHAQELIDMLCFQSKEKEEQNNDEEIIESLRQFIEMKCRATKDTENLIFGPRRVEFVKVNKVRNDDCQQLTPD